MPKLNLERNMAFTRLSTIEVSQTLSFNIVAVVCASLGMGARALGLGMLTQSVVGTFLAFLWSPYRPALHIEKTILNKLLGYGLKYQVKNIVNVLNQAVTPIYGGAQLGMNALGLIEWGRSTAFFSMRIVELFTRVTFPLISRLHDDPKAQSRVLSKNIFLAAVWVFLLSIVFLARGADITKELYTSKWLPAVPLLHVYANTILIAFISPILAAGMDAIGKPGVFARVAIMWTLVNWIAVPIGTHLGGVIGFTMAHCVHMVVGNIAIIIVARYYFPDLKIVKLWLTLLGAAFFTLVAERYLRPFLPSGVVGLVLSLLSIGALYLSIVISSVGRFWRVTWQP